MAAFLCTEALALAAVAALEFFLTTVRSFFTIFSLEGARAIGSLVRYINVRNLFRGWKEFRIGRRAREPALNRQRRACYAIVFFVAR